MTKEVNDLKNAIRFQGLCVAFMALTFLTSVFTLAFVIVKIGSLKSTDQAPSISQEANPQITTNLHVPDEHEKLEAIAEEQGYYTRDQFAEKYNVNPRTVDLWREDGLPFESTTAGRIRIPLDASPPGTLPGTSGK